MDYLPHLTFVRQTKRGYITPKQTLPLHNRVSSPALPPETGGWCGEGSSVTRRATGLSENRKLEMVPAKFSIVPSLGAIMIRRCVGVLYIVCVWDFCEVCRVEGNSRGKYGLRRLAAVAENLERVRALFEKTMLPSVRSQIIKLIRVYNMQAVYVVCCRVVFF